MSKKSIIITITSIILLIVLALGIGAIMIQSEESSIDGTDVDQLISAITDNNPDAVLTVGVWENGETDYSLYGENGKILPKELHTYQIGSVTKTFTGALVAKEVEEGLISIDNTINKYVSMPDMDNCPTVKSLLTHTSGLDDQWEQALEEDENVVFSREDIINLLHQQKLSDDNDVCYSNYGTALLGTVAADRRQMSYQEAMNKFISNELQLKNTKAGGKGDFKYNWNWHDNDEMMGAGAITSNVTDLLDYGKSYLDGKHSFLDMSTKPLGSFMDDYQISYFWIIDQNNDITWHNGELSMDDESGNEVGYQSFIGISKSRNKVVVILSNAIVNDEEDSAYTDMLGYAVMD